MRPRLAPEQAFLASSWVGTWGRAALPEQRWLAPLHYACVRHGAEGLVAAFPFAFQAFGPLRFASLAGPFHPWRGIAAVPARPEQTLDVLIECLDGLGRGCIGLRLGPVVDSDAAITALLAALAARGWSVISRPLGHVFEIDLPPSPAAFEAERKSLIKKTVYFHRRLERLAAVTIVRHRPAEPEWDAVIERLATIEQRSWLAKGGSFRFAGRRNADFWRGIAADPFLSDAIGAWILYADDEPISFSVTLDAGSRLFILANNYDERFAIHSTGQILAHRVMVDAIGRGMRLIDWGQGDSGYKQRWGAEKRLALSEHLALRPGLLGRGLARLAKWHLARR